VWNTDRIQHASRYGRKGKTSKLRELRAEISAALDDGEENAKFP
jgi:hypothetical protein